MGALGAIALAAILLLVLRLHRRWDPSLTWNDLFVGLESAVAILAIAGAAGWYFVAKPDAAKIKLEQNLVAYPIDPGSVLLISEVILSNVGTTTLTLDGERYQYFVQRITPLPKVVLAELGARNGDGTIRTFEADKWVSVAKTTGSVHASIESGEPETLYFRTVLKCDPKLRLYATMWLDKPPTWIEFWRFKTGLGDDPFGRLKWVKQTPIDLTEHCGGRSK